MDVPAERAPPIGRGVGTSQEKSLYAPADDIILLFDGTWCGRATGTTGNVKILADAFASMDVDIREDLTAAHKLHPEIDEFGENVYEKRINNDKGYVRYFEGPGIEGSLENYIINGMFALDIREHCVKIYRTIVRRYKPGSRVWLFGLSRGAFIVRSAAAMINNFGILQLEKIGGVTGDWETKTIDAESRRQLQLACQAVYDMYRSSDPYYSPQSPFSKRFRKNMSWQPVNNQSPPPIRFMGLFDTVGALGVPLVQAGIHFGYEFYDQKVSSEVQTVCQALAMTDRLSVFEPCYVRRNTDTYRGQIKLETEEVWFAGSHYDIGRQRFIFPRKFFDEPTSGPEPIPPSGLKKIIEAVPRAIEGIGRWVLQTLQVLQVDYTPELSNPPLLYIINRVQCTTEGAPLLSRLPEAYIKAFSEDPSVRERTWQLITLRAGLSFSIDAYDAIYEVWRSIPVLGNLFNGVVNGQLLADRCIPLYRTDVRTAFYDKNLRRRPDNRRLYASEALDRHLALLGGEGEIVYLESPNDLIPAVQLPDPPPPDIKAQVEACLRERGKREVTKVGHGSSAAADKGIEVQMD